MKCPICKQETKLGDPFMPFCSQRCKQTDLGNWASEKYKFSTSIEPNSEIPREDLEKNGDH
jgi:uncharacterized protein